MKINEVPQDKGTYRGREQNRKIMYATDDNGAYTTINSDGWEVEHLATKQAWEQAEQEMEEVLQDIQAGRLSPLAYFMKKNLMDVGILSRHVGKWQWQVKSHLKPSGFAKLSNIMLEKYARALNTTIEEIKNFNAATAKNH